MQQMLIKEEIVAKVLKFVYENHLDITQYTVMNDAALCLWELKQTASHITLGVNDTAFNSIAVNNPHHINFDPIFPGQTTPTPGMLIGDISVFKRRVQLDELMVADGTLEDISILSAVGLGTQIVSPHLDYYTRNIKKWVCATNEVLTLLDVKFMLKVLYFDEYYQYSDDGGVYRAGLQKDQEIKEVCKDPRFEALRKIVVECKKAAK